MKKLWQNYTQQTKCRQCGKEFQVYIHNLKKGFGKHCSKICSNRATPHGFEKGHGDFRNRKTPKGKTGNPEYQTLHRWVNKELGKPEKCSKCGRDKLRGRKINWASKSRLYKWSLKDWIRLCIKCHAKYDG